MNGELVVVDDLAGEFAERIIEAFRHRSNDEFSLALSGGQTARRCYERLAAESASRIDWWLVEVYWGDERCVPPEDADSNERLGREALLERVGAAGSIHPMRCDDGPDPYQMRIGELGRLDVVHLGLGADGHTASLFPGSPGLDADPGRLVVMNEDPSGSNRHPRMTLTLSGIARARLVLFTVAGVEKRAAMQRIVDGEDLPAARVHADRVVWLVDREAAPLAQAANTMVGGTGPA
ncbi:MAG: 6-phosphogluconolactonase [Actinomycetota bacterium]|nr:6-phosphogluconolactonase [Actinomycetota bacterium]PLS75987.1 MAG: 6-phosphogluconolactonase [Actinomycetota bacterium]